MIYTASYFHPEHHHGKLISISRSNPKEFARIPKLEFFAPSKELLVWWKKSNNDQLEYRSKFAEELAANKNKVISWLWQSHRYDITLLCREHPGEFCHRQIVGNEIQAHLPNCWGGDNIPQTKIEELTSKCQHKGLEIKCERLTFENNFSFYEIKFGKRNLGIWTQMGAENVLSQFVEPVGPASWFIELGVNPVEVGFQPTLIR